MNSSGKYLIITEKPSVAKCVLDALQQRESFKKQNGYYESSNYIISWCFGHLLELKSVNDYESKRVKWNDIRLPYIPNKFEYKLKDDTGVKKQFKVLKELINSSTVTAIYNCGDCDSEGQILVDEVIAASKNKKMVYRMILPDQTEKTIDRKSVV